MYCIRKFWGGLGLVLSICAPTWSQTITKVEYFVNTDPGFGQGTTITGYTPSADLSNFTTSLNLADVPNGLNTLFIRARNNNGSWSITNSIPFLKAKTRHPLATIAKAEYFFDADPGFDKGENIAITSDDTLSNINVALNLDQLSNGIHVFYIRAMDANGSWSITNSIPFFKQGVTNANIKYLEYFIDTDPGFGEATSLPISPSKDIANQSFSIDLLGESLGSHVLYIRAKDDNGNWSLVNSTSFTKTLVSGIERVQEEAGFLAFPNPSSNGIFIVNNSMQNVVVRNTSGIIVLNTVTSDNRIDLSHQPKGTYFAEIKSGEKILIQKLMVE